MRYRLIYMNYICRDVLVIENENVCEVGETEGIGTQLRMKLQGKAYSIWGRLCWGMVQAGGPEASCLQDE